MMLEQFGPSCANSICRSRWMSHHLRGLKLRMRITLFILILPLHMVLCTQRV